MSPPDPLLHALGRNVRTRRNSRGWSREALAGKSGLSARFLGDVEGGRANISVVKLARVARALGATAADLLAPGRARTVALLGLRGAGKSTVGPLLAKALDVTFVELDALIEERAGLSLYDIFSVHGERLYRRHEAEALEEFLSEGRPAVLATGGGLIAARDTYDRLQRDCITVWLRADSEDHMRRVELQGDRRPMENRDDAMAELRDILDDREPLYAEADVVVDTSGRAPSDVAAAIQNALV